MIRQTVLRNSRNWSNRDRFALYDICFLLLCKYYTAVASVYSRVLKFYQTIQGTLNYKRIYNCPLNCCRKNVETAVVCNAVSIGCTWGDLIEKGRRGNQKFAYPTFGIRGMTSVVALYRTLVLLLEWLPSTLCDTILGLVGAKKRYNELEIYDILNFDSSRTVECTTLGFSLSL